MTKQNPLLRTTLTVQQRVLGNGHLDTLVTSSNIALLLVNTDRHAEAEVISRGALAQAKRTLGHDHPYSLRIANTLAVVLGPTAEAKALLKDTLAAQRCVLGPEHQATQVTAQLLQRFQLPGWPSRQTLFNIRR